MFAETWVMITQKYYKVLIVIDDSSIIIKYIKYGIINGDTSGLHGGPGLRVAQLS